MSLPLDEPVRLRPEFTDVYALAPAGAIGYARRRKDGEGFPMVFIEWDKTHWSYSGETDKWTFENHFEPVKGEPMSEEEKNLPPELQAEIVKLFQKYAPPSPEGAEEVAEEVAEVPESVLFDLDNEADYKELAKAAAEKAADGNAFLLIGVQEKEFEGERVFVPFVVKSYLDELAGIFLESQLSHFTFTSHEGFAIELINRLRAEEGKAKIEKQRKGL